MNKESSVLVIKESSLLRVTINTSSSSQTNSTKDIFNSISISSSYRFQIRHVPSLHDCHRKCGGSDLRPTAGFSWPVTVGRQSDRPAGQNHKYRSGEFVLYSSVTSRMLVAAYLGWTHIFFFSKTRTEFKTLHSSVVLLVRVLRAWYLCLENFVGMFLSNIWMRRSKC